MVIEITLENEAWVRADLKEYGEPDLNLYHAAFYSTTPIFTQYQDAANYVKFHWPKYKNVRIVTDLGSATTVI